MEEEKNLLGGLLLELRRGMLVLSVLSQMGEPKYGYALVQSLEKQGVEIDPNTLYPLLRRLEKQGLLRVYDQQFQGRNRRYYAITAAGRAQLEAYRAEWNEYQKRLSHLILQEEEKTK